MRIHRTATGSTPAALWLILALPARSHLCNPLQRTRHARFNRGEPALGGQLPPLRQRAAAIEIAMLGNRPVTHDALHRWLDGRPELMPDGLDHAVAKKTDVSHPTAIAPAKIPDPTDERFEKQSAVTGNDAPV